MKSIQQLLSHRQEVLDWWVMTPRMSLSDLPGTAIIAKYAFLYQFRMLFWAPGSVALNGGVIMG